MYASPIYHQEDQGITRTQFSLKWISGQTRVHLYLKEMGAHTIRIKCSIVQFLFFMAPSLYCSHSSAGNTMKSQFLSWDMESIKNSYANWSSGKTQKCLETMAWLSFPLLSRFCKGKKGQQLLWSWEYSIHVRAWKFMVMEWIFACSLCTSLIISLLFMWLVLVLDIHKK